MKLLRSFSVVTLVASLGLAGPIPPPPNFPGGGAGGASGTASVTLTTPHQGGGIYNLDAVGTFTAAVDDMQPDSFRFTASLNIQGPGGAYANLGPSHTTLGPGDSISNWVLDTTNTATTSTSGTYTANVLLTATQLPLGEAQVTAIIDQDSDQSTVP